MNHLERFIAVMEYQPVDRVPNWEAGAWPQARERWESEGLDPSTMHWDWFPGEEAIGLDPREFIFFEGEMIPPFEEKALEEDDETITYRDTQGRVRRALKEGSVGMARMSMDQYLDFPVHDMDDWIEVKKRMLPADRRRYEAYWPAFRAKGWRS